MITIKFKIINGILSWYAAYIKNNIQPTVFNNLNNTTSLTMNDIKTIIEAQYAIISI